MVINDRLEQCYQCEACVQACPVHAIHMEDDGRGFRKPKIDEAVCINCGLCARVCPLNVQMAAYKHGVEEQHIRGIKRLDEKKRRESQSGGAFSVIAEYVLAQHGVVYGAALDDDLNCRYQRVDKAEELVKLKGSKYVQAEVGEVYQSIREDLKKGSKVLFGGTACAVLGLKTFLGEEPEGLITCDLVCHGVASPDVYRHYRDYQEKRHGEKLTGFNFRDKKFGWHSHVETFTLESGKEEADVLYRNLYYGHLCMRESCYHCPFADMSRVSDITIGDFWGIEKTHAEWDDNLGISLFITNTPKGEAVFQAVSGELEYIVSNSGECMQPHLAYPVQKPEGVELFWEEYRNKNFYYILKKYGSDNQKFLGDVAVTQNLETKKKKGINIANYFTERNCSRIALCGLNENTEALIAELEAGGISVECVLETVCDNAECRKYACGKPVIPIAGLNAKEVEEIDRYVVMCEQFFLDIVQELRRIEVPLYKVAPISFLTAMEV